MKLKFISLLVLNLVVGFSIFAQQSLAQNVRTTQSQVRRITRQGHPFIRDRSVPALREAWRDDADVIWGDIVKWPNGSIFFANGPAGAAIALRHCQRIGAELPTLPDFDRLRRQMGTSTSPRSLDGSGYVPQVLPHLFFTDQAGESVRYNFWSAPAGRSGMPYIFDGLTGHIDNYKEEYRDYDVAFRCVVRR